jgi:hypothetical protein
MCKIQKREQTTTKPTPVFEEVLPRLGSQSIVGESPVIPGQNRLSVGKDTEKRRREEEEVTTIERTETMVNAGTGKPLFAY